MTKNYNLKYKFQIITEKTKKAQWTKVKENINRIAIFFYGCQNSVEKQERLAAVKLRT